MVTGAARGIGRAVAVALAGVGAGVVGMDVLDVQETMDAARAVGGQARAMQVDVTDREAVRRAFAAAVPDRRLDILVTAAGVYGRTTDIDDLEEDELEAVLAVNLKGALWCVQAALPMMRRHGGSIVCIGSVAGKVGGVLAGPHYVASKGAVHALVKWVARTQAVHGVRANGVAPGAVETEMIRGKGYTPDYCPLGRLGRPEDVAQAVLFLASPASDYVTGTVLDVNGGYFMGS
ncbi:MAG TPA: SDR family NAD(P)-dependent oxidoreductase [Candidatus Dormibacteraeota bacterium]|nr:SDR family NAD(P)-dependent oxidoreductase [Candidatus Dormibacteraeota bacterium]